VPALNRLYEQYRDRAAFHFVYIREAHTVDGWQVLANLAENVLFANTRTLQERMDLAGVCQRKLRIEFPTVVDEAEDRVERAYWGWPDRLYVVDREGRIALKGHPGPYGLKPKRLKGTLARLFRAGGRGAIGSDKLGRKEAPDAKEL
jgi:type I thyroxine 5'-deiodinase